LPEENIDFGDVWKIYIHPDGVFFQTYYQLFIYKNEKFTVIDAPSLFHFSFMVNNEYYVNDIEKGLMRYAMGNLYPLSGMEPLKGKKYGGYYLLIINYLLPQSSDGTYLYDGNSLTPVSNTETTSF